jgi:hypothetical protein
VSTWDSNTEPTTAATKAKKTAKLCQRHLQHILHSAAAWIHLGLVPDECTAIVLQHKAHGAGPGPVPTLGRDGQGRGQRLLQFALLQCAALFPGSFAVDNRTYDGRLALIVWRPMPALPWPPLPQVRHQVQQRYRCWCGGTRQTLRCGRGCWRGRGRSSPPRACTALATTNAAMQVGAHGGAHRHPLWLLPMCV